MVWQEVGPSPTHFTPLKSVSSRTEHARGVLPTEDQQRSLGIYIYPSSLLPLTLPMHTPRSLWMHALTQGRHPSPHIGTGTSIHRQTHTHMLWQPGLEHVCSTKQPLQSHCPSKPPLLLLLSQNAGSFFRLLLPACFQSTKCPSRNRVTTIAHRIPNVVSLVPRMVPEEVGLIYIPCP